jgi:hypothetical protein
VACGTRGTRPLQVAILRPWSSASYLAVLLVARKCICKTYLKLSPLGDVTSIPTLHLEVVRTRQSWWSNTPALFLWKVSGSPSTQPQSRLKLEPWSLSLACRQCHTWTTQWPIWQFSRSPPSCSLSNPESMKCELQSGVPENNGIAYGMWLAVSKRASWYEITESWNHSALRWWSKPGTRSCDWCLIPPSFDDDCHTNHVACSQYVKLHVFMSFRDHQGGRGSEIFF